MVVRMGRAHDHINVHTCACGMGGLHGTAACVPSQGEVAIKAESELADTSVRTH